MIRHSATVSPQSRHRAAGAVFPPAPTPVLPPCPHSFERVNKACLRFRYLFDPILFTSRKENLFVEQFEHSHHTDEKFRQIFQRVSFFGVFFFFFIPRLCTLYTLRLVGFEPLGLDAEKCALIGSGLGVHNLNEFQPFRIRKTLSPAKLMHFILL